MCSEHIQGDEWGTYVALVRAAPPERGMAYRARAPRARSPRSSLGWGKPTTWRRGTGRRQGKGGRVRDAQEPEPKCLSSTGELIDIERVTISSEGDRWKSTRWGNSLAVYPTSSPVLEQWWASRLAHRLWRNVGNSGTPLMTSIPTVGHFVPPTGAKGVKPLSQACGKCGQGWCGVRAAQDRSR
jgi:hypothetical protein